MSQEIYEQNLEVIAGNTFTLDMTLINEDENGNEIPDPDLVGATAIMQLRKNVASPNPEIEVIGIINPTTAIVQFTLTNTQTENLLPNPVNNKINLVYGCQVAYSDGSVFTIMAGKFTVIRGVVRLAPS